MYQFNPLNESIRLAPSNATKAQRKKLAKYIKQHMFIRRATNNPKQGNQVVRNLANDFIKNGYKDNIPVNQKDLNRAIMSTGL